MPDSFHHFGIVGLGKMGSGSPATRWAKASRSPGSTGTTRELTGHETLCILNAGEQETRGRDHRLFRRPGAGRPLCIHHRGQTDATSTLQRFPRSEPIPKGADFSSVVRANVPVVVQHTRLDTRQPALALLSTMAFPLDG
jgi:hypothetical protein